MDTKTVTVVWIKVVHPKTGRFIGQYCPQTHQLEVVDRKERAVIELPKQKQ